MLWQIWVGGGTGKMPSMKGTGIGGLMVVLIVFGMMLVGLNSGSANMTANASTAISEPIQAATNTAWTIFGLTFAAVVGLVVLGVRGTITYRW